jgi:hypothetical protein
MQRLVIDRDVALVHYHGTADGEGEDGATVEPLVSLALQVGEDVVFEDGQRHEARVTSIDGTRIDLAYTDGTTNVWSGE